MATNEEIMRREGISYSAGTYHAMFEAREDERKKISAALKELKKQTGEIVELLRCEGLI